jgi:8-oxo-dGTP pyrophosphatase MutT (NUDIX family)
MTQSGSSPPGPALVREFTVAVFVVRAADVLLLFHRKLQKWLPPGGHIDLPELPDEAACREVWEETGLRVRLIGEDTLPVDYPPQLIRPAGIQLEDIGPGHQHIDLIYYAVPEPSDQALAENRDECEQCGWFSAAQIDELPVPEDVRVWARRAVAAVGRLKARR